MKPGWNNILTSTDYFKIQLLHALLIKNNIPAIIMNKKDSLYLFGDIELYVKKEDILNAKKLIQSQK